VTVPGTIVQNTGSALTSKTEATGTTIPTFRAMGRTIIGPLAAQTISGTIKGQMRCAESNGGANATLMVAAKIVQPGGSDRGVLLARSAADLLHTTAWEMAITTLTNRKFGDAAENASITLTSQAATAGDYLVIEWGFRSSTGTSRNITLRYGNASATDLAEDTTETTDNNPWWEFSGDLKWLREADGASTPSVTSAGVGAKIEASVGASASSVTSSADGENGNFAPEVEADASSAAATTAAGVGAAVAQTVGASAAQATSAAAGAAVALSNASSAASAASQALSAAVMQSDGAAAAEATAAASTASLVTAAGAAQAATTSSAASQSIITAVVSAGVAVTSAGTSATLSAAVGNTAVTVTIDGQMEDTSFGVTAEASTTTSVSGASAYFIASNGAASVVTTVAALKVPVVTGTVRDIANAPMPGCPVKLFRASDDVLVTEVTSGATGRYEFVDPAGEPFYAASFDITETLAGITVPTLVAA